MTVDRSGPIGPEDEVLERLLLRIKDYTEAPGGFLKPVEANIRSVRPSGPVGRPPRYPSGQRGLRTRLTAARVWP